MATYYRERGYDCKYGDKIIVNIEDLPQKSNLKVDVKCDFCGKEYQLRYSDFNKIVGKVCCQDCNIIKRSNTNQEKYGTTCTLHNEEVRKKVIEANFKKYNTAHPMQNEEVKAKTSKTNMDKYGVGCVLKNGDISKKIENTNKEKYGAKNVFTSNIIKDKIKKLISKSMALITE